MNREHTAAADVEQPPDAVRVPIEPARRRRPRMTLTLHPDTESRLAWLAEKFQTGRGQMVDKLVATLYSTAHSGVLHCVHGHRCSINRTDAPVVF